jgi:transposase
MDAPNYLYEISSVIMARHPANNYELRRLYEVEGLSMSQIGKRFGVSRQRVHQRLHEAGVQGRPNTSRPMFLDRDILYQLFVIRELTREEVGKHIGVSPAIVARELRRHNLLRPSPNDPRRIDRHLLYRLYVTDGLDQREVAEKVGLSTRIVRRELRRHNIDFRHRPGQKNPFTRDQLFRLYVKRRLTCKEMGKILHVNERTVSFWLKKNGINIRPGGRLRRRGRIVRETPLCLANGSFDTKKV